MSLILIIGPPAVGKMTVGQALEARLGFRLFHNHTAIEVVAPYFSYGTPEGRGIVHKIREAFFDVFADDSDGGYILTFVWAFDIPSERAYAEGIANTFRNKGHPVYLVELEADFDTRLARNRTENRLAQKPTKRDLDWSDAHLREVEAEHRFNSLPGEMDYENYLRIDNTALSPTEVATTITNRFDLSPIQGS